MLIIGAGGLATQLFHDLVTVHTQDVAFWSETETKYSFIAEKYPLLQTDAEVEHYFKTVSTSFVLGVGNPLVREKLKNRFESLGGRLTTYISPFCELSPYQTTVATGATILSRVITEPGVSVGYCSLLNKTSNFGHGSIIGAFCEVGPGVILTGECELEDYVFIGTGAILLPKVKIGKSSVIAAGAMVKKNVPANSLASGVPAVVYKTKKE
jgi:sugar O-acyltransferase (sialic acid O-acetyltransferase NeuD family)